VPSEQIAAGHPLNRAEFGAQLHRDRGDGDVDDAGVEHRQQQAGQQRVLRGDPQLLARRGDDGRSVSTPTTNASNKLRLTLLGSTLAANAASSERRRQIACAPI